MKYVIAETKVEYHLVEADEDLDMESIIQQVKTNLSKYEYGWEAIRELLDLYELNFGICGTILPNECGKEVLNIEITQAEENDE